MDATTIGIDLAKEVFEVAMANDRWRVIKRERLTRPRFERLLKEHPAAHLILEACGSAHYWARTAQRLGHQVTLLPSQYVRPYVRRQKTDRTDAEAMLEAARSGGAEWRHSAGGREDGDAAGRVGAASDARPMDDDPDGTAQRHARPAAGTRHRDRAWRAHAAAAGRGPTRERGRSVAAALAHRAAPDRRRSARSGGSDRRDRPGTCRRRRRRPGGATVDAHSRHWPADGHRDGGDSGAHSRVSACASIRELAGTHAARTLEWRPAALERDYQTRRCVSPLPAHPRGPRGAADGASRRPRNVAAAAVPRMGAGGRAPLRP